MRVQEHIKLSTTAAVLTLPWLKQDVWIPLIASVLIDVDHYLWHVATQHTLSLRAATRYYEQANPPQIPQQRLLHHPLVLALLLIIAARSRSRRLWLILCGLIFHVGLDVIHKTQMSSLKQTLSEQAQASCPACGKHCDALQLHTLHVSSNIFDKYNPAHYMMLCPQCHVRAHRHPDPMHQTPTREVSTFKRVKM
jgi:hypothetical protein